MHTHTLHKHKDLRKNNRTKTTNKHVAYGWGYLFFKEFFLRCNDSLITSFFKKKKIFISIKRAKKQTKFASQIRGTIFFLQ